MLFLFIYPTVLQIDGANLAEINSQMEQTFISDLIEDTIDGGSSQVYHNFIGLSSHGKPSPEDFTWDISQKLHE